MSFVDYPLFYITNPSSFLLIYLHAIDKHLYVSFMNALIFKLLVHDKATVTYVLSVRGYVETLE